MARDHPYVFAHFPRKIGALKKLAQKAVENGKVSEFAEIVTEIAYSIDLYHRVSEFLTSPSPFQFFLD
jgi:hypothetical protein